jgi:hypothetical protein
MTPVWPLSAKPSSFKSGAVNIIYWGANGVEEEEVKTYSELVVRIRSKLLSKMEEWAGSFREAAQDLRVSGHPVEHKTARFRGVVGAVDGGSMIIPFADKLVGVASALAVRSREQYERRILEPSIMLQEGGEEDGGFMDRVDVERETMVMGLANEILDSGWADLLIVDGPLIPRPKYVGEYLYQLGRLLERAEREGRLTMGFVKRPQSAFLDEFGETGFMDRAILASALESGQVYPWPPRTHAVKFFELKYTYLKMLNPPLSGVFRLDFPKHLSDEEIMEVIGYLAGSADPQSGVPAILMKADEEVKMSRRLMIELYRDCFMKVATDLDPRLWSPLAPRWGEMLW